MAENDFNTSARSFLLEFGFDTLRDLPDFEALEDAGLLSKEKLLAGDMPSGLGSGEHDEGEEEPKGQIVEDEMSLSGGLGRDSL
ncbi:MAG: hypothetical protein E5W26_00190 [Mesorhizobium sp.]|nr:MAG: hypothetical protein E5W26_00190 [Mesorhizobium sp.]TIV62405.1 MAG: hypothetical protein E5V80_00655 [Mesorhizobium sp.]